MNNNRQEWFCPMCNKHGYTSADIQDPPYCEDCEYEMEPLDSDDFGPYETRNDIYRRSDDADNE